MNTEKKKQLVEWFRTKCKHRNLMSDNKTYYCRLKYEQRCNNTANWYIDFPDCPETCPHHIRQLPIGCESGVKCKYIHSLANEIIDILK